ncbi:MAG TPA: hypothetical protein VFE01_06070 [Terracidiphilus sp.]|jgi:hypothetical protein|nr:hypothetical protein [Terracidiphilus sp.]
MGDPGWGHQANCEASRDRPISAESILAPGLAEVDPQATSELEKAKFDHTSVMLLVEPPQAFLNRTIGRGGGTASDNAMSFFIGCLTQRQSHAEQTELN